MLAGKRIIHGRVGLQTSLVSFQQHCQWLPNGPVSVPYLLLNILTSFLFLALIFYALLMSSLPSTVVNETNFWRLEPLINTMLNANYTKGTLGLNVLLTLRLVGIKNQSLEQQLSQQIKEDINSGGECLCSPEYLGKDLPIYKDDLQWVLEIVCPSHPWYIHLSCRKLEMNRSRNKILYTWNLYNVINQCYLNFFLI